MSEIVTTESVKYLLELMKSSGPDGNENDKTVRLWREWLDKKLKLHTVFDSYTQGINRRPDLQVWLKEEHKKAGQAPKIWIEAKDVGSFRKHRNLHSARNEISSKISEILIQKKRQIPLIILSDFENHEIWNPEDLLNQIESGLKKPTLPFSNSSDNNTILTIANLLNNQLLTSEIASRNFLVDKLVSDFLAISEIFQNTLPEVHIFFKKNPASANVFSVWKKHGGTAVLEILNKNDNITDEEAFAELCFHSLITRLFAIKWCLDHGFLNQKFQQNKWDFARSAGTVESFRNLLIFTKSSKIENILNKIFKSSDMYLWVIDLLPKSLIVQMLDAFSRQSLISDDVDILGTFYQKYISNYSKKAQFELGQFYTPFKLVRAMWKLVNDSLEGRGLSLKDDQVITIDPSTGTGTFLAQGIRYSLSDSWTEVRRQMDIDDVSGAAKRFCGLEINPFSKGVADVNLMTEMLLHCKDAEKGEFIAPQIFETNSYDFDPRDIPNNTLFDTSTSIESWRERWSEARKIKSSTYKVVIGNPPWRNPSPAMKSDTLKKTIKEQIVPWSYEYKGERLSAIQGAIHGVREEYAYFYGVGHKLVRENGLICYVTSESWLTGPMFTLFRKHMLDNYVFAALIRIGPYFNGVKEKACVALLERSSAATRDQTIPILDWSDTSNKSVWDHQWINFNLDRLISGKIKKSEWLRVTPTGSACTIQMESSEKNSFEMNFLVVSEIATKIIQGAQSGCGPLFYDEDVDRLTVRMKKFFKGTDENHRKIASELSESVKGGEEKAYQLVKDAYTRAQTYSAKFNQIALTKVLAYRKSAKKNGQRVQKFCYFDPRIWLFPRVERTQPGQTSLWKMSPKLIFRDSSDIGATPKPITAFIDTEGSIIDNHALNGGTQLIIFSNNQNSIQAELSAYMKLSNEEWMYYLLAIFRSNYAQNWANTRPKERLPIPVHTSFLGEIRKISKIGRESHDLFHSIDAREIDDIGQSKLKKALILIDEQLEAMKKKSHIISREESVRTIFKLVS